MKAIGFDYLKHFREGNPIWADPKGNVPSSIWWANNTLEYLHTWNCLCTDVLSPIFHAISSIQTSMNTEINEEL